MQPIFEDDNAPSPYAIAALGGLAVGAVATLAVLRRRVLPGTLFTIVMENRGRSQVIGSPQAPYLTYLAQSYVDLTNYSGTLHPSLPNYVVMTSGTTGDITDDTGHTVLGNQNLAAQLDRKGIAWRAYAESMPSACYQNDSGRYAVRHVPFLYYDYVTHDPNYCAQHVVTFEDNFATDLASSAYPYMWITPDLIDDMHDGTIADGDNWVRSVMQQIVASPAYLNGGAVFILWDEAEGGDTTIPGIIVSERLRSMGQQVATSYDHKSYLATVEDLLGLPRLASTRMVPSMRSLFR